MEQVSPTRQPTVTLVRHGATEWSTAGRHTGRTDIALTAEGEAEAKGLGALFAGVAFDLVLVSPLQRARVTAELAGLTPYELDDDLQEWDYGDLEGLTTPQIQETLPAWSIWSGPWPGGESPEQVGERSDRVLRRAMLDGSGERVALVAHGHILRALAARWLGQPVGAGRWLALDTATSCELGWEHGGPVVHRWNVPPAPLGR